MNVSIRSYLMAGAVAVTATSLALAPVQVTPADVTVAVPADPTSGEPHLTQAMIDLLAAAGRMTSALPADGTDAPAIAPASTPPVRSAAAPTATAIAPNLANTIDQIYQTVEPWVQYGFQLGAAALGWVPWVGGVAGGLLMDAYAFGQSLVASGVYNFTDWLRGDGGIVENLLDFGVDVGLAFVWLGLDVVNTFIPLPPIPLPPRPPLQGPFLATGLTTPSIEGALANPLGAVTDALTRAGEELTSTVEKLVEKTGLAITDGVETEGDTDRVAADAESTDDAAADTEGTDEAAAGQGGDEAPATGDEGATAGDPADEPVAKPDEDTDRQTVRNARGRHFFAVRRGDTGEAGDVPTSVRRSLRGERHTKPESTAPADDTAAKPDETDAATPTRAHRQHLRPAHKPGRHAGTAHKPGRFGKPGGNRAAAQSAGASSEKSDS